jgi:ribosomal protein S8E
VASGPITIVWEKPKDSTPQKNIFTQAGVIIVDDTKKKINEGGQFASGKMGRVRVPTLVGL